MQSTLVTAEHFRYLAERTRPQDAFLTDLRRAAKAAAFPPINIAPEQASFLQILLRLNRARDVIEVGTLGGYSAIAMARALPEGGSVRTPRAEDILPLLNHFLGLHCTEQDKSIEGFDSTVIDLFTRYPWPENVRELHNAVGQMDWLDDWLRQRAAGDGDR